MGRFGSGGRLVGRWGVASGWQVVWAGRYGPVGVLVLTARIAMCVEKSWRVVEKTAKMK